MINSLLMIQDKPEPGEANVWFHDVYMVLLVIIPLLIVILLAASKRKSKPELPHADDLSWDVDVTESDVPVIVHAYQSWSIGDRVIEAQVEKLGELADDRAKTLWLDIDKCPGVVDRFPTLEEKCVALFRKGRLVWQSQGVQDHQSMWREIEPILG